jgi:hypothetical protein
MIVWRPIALFFVLMFLIFVCGLIRIGRKADDRTEGGRDEQEN